MKTKEQILELATDGDRAALHYATVLGNTLGGAERHALISDVYAALDKATPPEGVLYVRATR